MDMLAMEEATLTVGLLGGSFNPIHIGHLALANYLCEYGGVDEVWFMVSPHNPLKSHAELWDDDLRLQLVREAIDGYPRFKVTDIEFQLPRPSYMVHTLDALKERYPAVRFVPIIGSDNWHCFTQWFQYERILNENHLLVYPRPGFPIDAQTLPASVTVVDAPLLDISSTFIRESLKTGKDIRFFLPPTVYRYLQAHRADLPGNQNGRPGE